MSESKVLRLIELVRKNEKRLKYINLDEDFCYAGWVSNFNIKNNQNENICLDLHKEEDLFLLFVLASAWSRTGSWENAAYFTAYLKLSCLTDINDWGKDSFVEYMCANNSNNLKEIHKYCVDITSRKKISFRIDYYSSIQVIAKHWHKITEELNNADKNGDWLRFCKYLNSIEGLGYGTKKMKIKIPLILRELRTQRIYNISGEFCCVTDDRVKKAARELGIYIPTITNIESVIKTSQVIYSYFGDLYDIALFAYADYKELI